MLKNNYKIMKNNKKGFTLIEILTVIMIIGILASVILVSMDTARKRAADTTIKNQIGQLRSLAEALYSFENHYAEFKGASGSTETEDGVRFNRVRTEINNINGDGEFKIVFSDGDSPAEYCMYSPLVREDGVYCVDSTGDATIETSGSYCDANARCRDDGSEESSSCLQENSSCDPNDDRCCSPLVCDIIEEQCCDAGGC